LSNPVLPQLEWKPLETFSSRNGKQTELVVVHTWGASHGATADGVWGYQSHVANQVSSHYIYGGTLPGPNKDRLIQGVKLADKAWTECGFNAIGISIENNDTILNWGTDPAGMEVLARIVAWHCHKYGLPPNWVRGKNLLKGRKGFCRHADLGAAGCGHLQCPTTNLVRWIKFVYLVKREYKRAGFRPDWQPK
jgi:N-acetylmuramoyl-L-alanine amidase